jgi:hypothetical protein
MTWGGLVCVIAVGNAIAALNWYSIAVGFANAQAAGSTLFATAEIYAQRYAFIALMLLLIGLWLVDRPRRGDEP